MKVKGQTISTRHWIVPPRLGLVALPPRPRLSVHHPQQGQSRRLPKLPLRNNLCGGVIFHTSLCAQNTGLFECEKFLNTLFREPPSLRNPFFRSGAKRTVTPLVMLIEDGITSSSCRCMKALRHFLW